MGYHQPAQVASGNFTGDLSCVTSDKKSLVLTYSSADVGSVTLDDPSSGLPHIWDYSTSGLFTNDGKHQACLATSSADATQTENQDSYYQLTGPDPSICASSDSQPDN